ncbi:MAG: hypothetical protein ABUK01_16430 [Leptospirales bacterium]
MNFSGVNCAKFLRNRLIQIYIPVVIISVIPIVTLFSVSSSYEQTDSNTKYKNRKYSANSEGDEFAMYLASKYSPDANYILHKLKTIKGLTFMKDGKIPDYWFSFGKNKTGTLSSMQVIVHEGNHIITSGLSTGTFSGMLYHTDVSKAVLVQRTTTFPAKEMRFMLPEFITGESKNVEGPGSNYYEIYVYPSNLNPSTQVYGIYGLLDEFNSYYHGKRATLDMFTYYKREAPHENSQIRWANFLQTMYSNYLAYYEFKVYILTYLIYAKEKHLEIYNNIIENKPFVYAFLTIDKLHQNLKKEFHKIEKDLLTDLQKQGEDISRPAEDRIKIGNEYAFHDRHKTERYIKVLESKKYVQMENFLRKQVTQR